jgi:FG-GAP-like repeat
MHSFASARLRTAARSYNQHAFIAAILFAFAASTHVAAQTVLWDGTYYASVLTRAQPGSSSDDCGGVSLHCSSSRPNSIALDSSGNVIAVVSVGLNGTDCRILKFPASGGPALWSRDFYGNHSEFDAKFCLVTVDPSDNVLAAGKNIEDFKAMKIAGATGAILWESSTQGAVPTFILNQNAVQALSADAAGNAILAGGMFLDNRYHARTIKFSGATGAIQWDRTESYGGVANAVAIDSSGNVVAAGWREDANGIADIWTSKYGAADGTPLWQQSYSGPAGRDDSAVAVALDQAGNVYLSGYATRSLAAPSSGYQRIFKTLKYSANGALLWDASFNASGDAGAFDDVANALSLDSAGNAYVSGRVADPAGGSSLQVVKHAASDGAVLWQWSISGAGAAAYGEAFASGVDSSGNLIVTGSIAQANAPTDFITAKLAAASGLPLWQHTYDGGPNFADDALAVAIDRDGAPIVFGSSFRSVSLARFDVKLLKYGSDGTLAWQQGPVSPSLANYTAPTAMAVDPSGNLIIAGFFLGPVTVPDDDNEDFVTVKVSAIDGTVLWTSVYAGPLPDGPTGLAIDAAGNAIVTGTVTQSNGFTDVQTFKYAAADGHVIWQATFNGPSNRNDGALALALDASGNVVVTGFVGTVSSGDMMKTIKYSGANGAILWESAATIPDRGQAISIDSSGNAIVSGFGHIVKYSGSTGSILWSKPFPGVATYAMVIDAAGNAIATGTSADGTLRTTKFASGDGAIVWDRAMLIDGDFASGSRIALDGAGNPVVAGIAGYSSSPSFSQRSVTLKYAAADGSLMWQRELGGATNTTMNPAVVLVDTGGNVVVAANETIPNSSAGAQMRIVKYSASGQTRWQFSYTGSATRHNDWINAIAQGPGALYLGAVVPEATTGEVTRVFKIDNSHNPTASDFNASGTGDLLWSNTDGQAAIWLMNGATAAGSAGILGPGSGWSVKHVADFDGDGRSDILWQHTDGSVAVWLMNGTTIKSSALLLGAGSGWSVRQTADLNGDGKADLVWQHADGSVAVWLMSGTAPIESAFLLGGGSGWSVAKVADFDGDGSDDLLWQNIDGSVAMWLMNGTTVKSSASLLGAGSGWSVKHTPDLDGDGKADILWQHTDGSTAVWLMNGASSSSSALLLGAGSGWSVAKVADFDGDGRADLLWQNTDGGVAIWLMNGTTMAGSAGLIGAGSGWSVKRTLDLNGDGKADLIWENVDGSTAAWLMNGASMSSGALVLGPGTGWRTWNATP